MTLPTDNTEDMKLFESLVSERPGDEVYSKLRPQLDDVNAKSENLRRDLKKLILDDMAIDIALASAIDDVGVMIEYHAQNLGIERPKFEAPQITRDVSRLARLRLIRECAQVLGFDEDTCEKITVAEIERSWFEVRNAGNTGEKAPANNRSLHLPDEVTSMLREIAKSLNKRKEPNVNPRKPSGPFGKRIGKPDADGGR